MPKKKQETLVIDRSKWSCGEYAPKDNNMLRVEENGKMCCLGFYCKQLGVTNKKMNGHGMPDRTIFDRRKHWLLPEDTAVTDTASEAAQFLAETNDDTDINDEVREATITKKFLEFGVKVKFRGKYPNEPHYSRLPEEVDYDG